MHFFLETPMNILFVCSKNKWRSKTAETIFKNSQAHKVRSAGVDAGSDVRLTADLLAWADIVFVMERKHKALIREKFSEAYEDSSIVVLDIPDEYQFMDEELVLCLRNGVATYIVDL